MLPTLAPVVCLEVGAGGSCVPAGEVWMVVPGAAEEVGTWNMGFPNTGEDTNCGARALGGSCRTSWDLLLLLGAVTMAVETTVEGV